jgi:MFS family permease
MLHLLNKEQKEAVGLLQIGTLLEYFDLMIYVHMAFFLNDLFFPKTDPQTAALLSAFALCSTYVLRPVGALLFGLIGDYIGRKATVIITSMMMGLSCILMAALPTYEQIGITAAWGVTFCRVLQGLSCQGEIIGAEIYLTEITKPPLRYVVVSLTSFFSSSGGMLALGIASLLFLFKIDWRFAFWIGAAISSIGFYARTRLRETPEFLLMKSNKVKVKKAATKDNDINKATMLSFFLISCGFPACFYLAYIHFGTLLKSTYGYTSEQLIHHNFILSVTHCASFLIYALLSYKFHPLQILKFRLLIFLPVMLLYPYWLSIINTPIELFIFQVVIMCFGIMDVPAAGVMMNHFPVLKRFTSTGLLYAFSRIAIYILTSFGFVYLTEVMNHWGVWLLMVILCLGFGWAVYYFEKLEGRTNRPFFIIPFKQRKNVIWGAREN